MKTKKQNSRGNVKYYVVLPTLEIMLSASKNCKIRQTMPTWNIPTL
nr:hypothetical protein [Prevotella aurantiaca]